MPRTELIKALNRLKEETGSLACLGCGQEQNCSTAGCDIINEAIRFLKFDRDLMKTIIETAIDWKGKVDDDPQ